MLAPWTALAPGEASHMTTWEISAGATIRFTG